MESALSVRAVDFISHSAFEAVTVAYEKASDAASKSIIDARREGNLEKFIRAIVQCHLQQSDREFLLQSALSLLVYAVFERPDYWDQDIPETFAVLLPSGGQVAQVIVSNIELNIGDLGRLQVGIYPKGIFEEIFRGNAITDYGEVTISISLSESRFDTTSIPVVSTSLSSEIPVLNNGAIFAALGVCGKQRTPSRLEKNGIKVKLADVVVPVFGAPELYNRFFSALLNAPEGVNRLLIADDHSDARAQAHLRSWVERLSSTFSIEYFEQENNLGFIKNVNFLYERVRTDIAVLLTTDVQVPQRWIERMIAPFQESTIVAAATPFATVGQNLTIALPPGASWRDVDDVLSSRRPRYPRACTVIGYCMAVNRKLLPPEEGLFDVGFENGYADDSDLHFRCLQNGYEPVIVDNMYVHHEGGKSFDQLLDKDSILEENRNRFFKKWGEKYLEEIRRFESAWPISHIVNREGSLAHSIPPMELDILFVLPTDDTDSGGVSVVIELVELMLSKGVRAAVFVINSNNKFTKIGRSGFRPFTDILTLTKRIFRVKRVFATAHDTVPLAFSLARRFNAISSYFVQGPEMAFSTGKFSRTVVEGLREADEVYCVSGYLKKYVSILTGRQDAVVIPMGARSSIFQARGNERQKRSIAMCAVSTPEKASGLALILAYALKRRGFSVTVFGKTAHEMQLDEDIRVLGWLGPEQLAELFSSVEFFIDTSVYEGLGLLPLEAAACGAIPVMIQNGGAASILQDKGGVILFEGAGTVDKVAEQLDSLSDEDKKHLMQSAIAGSQIVSFEKGAEHLIERINERWVQGQKSQAS